MKTYWRHNNPRLFLTLWLTLIAHPAQAIDAYWLGPSPWGWWDYAPNWSSGLQPGNGDNVYLIQSDSSDREVLYSNTLYPTAVLGSLYLNASGTGQITLSQTNHTLSSVYEFIGDSNKGIYNQSGGTHSVTTDINIGGQTTGYGSYLLSGGALSASFVNLGVNGTGLFDHSSGNNTLTTGLYLGKNSTGHGDYYLSGNGALSAVSEVIGDLGTGSFSQTGGTNTMTNSLTLGNQGSGNGSYNLSGSGTLSAPVEVIGNNGAGAFSQSGGSNTLTDKLQLGYGSTGYGTYGLTAGGLSAAYEYIGWDGAGIFTQSGGSNTVAAFLSLGSESTGDGRYDLSGNGTLAAGYEVIGDLGKGTFIQSSGTNTVLYDLSLGYGSSGDGSYNLSGSGTLSAPVEYIGRFGSGTFTQSDGTHTVTYLLSLGSESTGNGTYNLNGGTLNAGSIEYGAGTGAFNFNAGTLNLTNDLAISFTGPLADTTLTGRHTLAVGGTTTLSGAATLTLDGGTFSTGSLVNSGGFNFNSGTFNLTSDNLSVGTSGLFGDTLQVVSGQKINVTNTTTVDSNGLLYVNGGKFSAGNLVNNGQVALDGLLSDLGSAISNNGLLIGDGRVSGVLSNNVGGEVRVRNGDVMQFASSGNTNAGRINMLGGEVEFTRDLTNAAGGVITGRGTLIASGGLTNQGNIGLSSGTTDIFGDVNNTSGGSIIVSGNGTATFYDDLVHNGTEIRVSSGSNAVFFGAVSGAGSYTGTGSLFFEGDLNPGNSPGLVSVAGDMTLGLSSHTIMEVAGLARGTEYDAFNIGGELWLGGELEVSLYDTGSGLFDPQLGDSFDLFMADSISGDFDLWTLAALGGGLGWQLDVLADAIGLTDVVRLSVVTSAVPVPPAVWLFGSGLLGLIGVARRRQAA